MGIEIELLEQLKAATEAIKAVAEALNVEGDGSINVNTQNPIDIVAIKDSVDPNKKASVNNDGRLLVNTDQVISPEAIITDPDDANKQAKVNATGRLLVENEQKGTNDAIITDPVDTNKKAQVNASGRLLVETERQGANDTIIVDPLDSNKKVQVNSAGKLLVENEQLGTNDTIIVDPIDNNKKAQVDANGRLQVSAATGSSDLIGSVKIEDANDSNKKVLVDDSGRLLVSTPPPQPPPNTLPVILTGFGDVSGDVDSEYTITNGKKLVIGRLLAGAEEMTKAGRITLYEDADGTGTALKLISTMYVNGSSDLADLSESFTGDGVRKIILRRSNLGGGNKEMFARFEGYEE